MTRPYAGAGHVTPVDDIAEGIRKVSGAERSAVVIGEDDNAAIHFISATGPFADRLRDARGPAAGSGLAGTVLDGDCSVLAAQTIGDERVHQGHAREMAINTALGVPVRHHGHPFAVLMALNRPGGAPFTLSDQEALERYADEVAEGLWKLVSAERSE